MRGHLLRLFAAIVVIGGGVVVANPASAAPSPVISAAQFGANPSGKVDASGKPLHHPKSGAPQATASQSLSQSLAATTPECPPILASKCSYSPAAYQNNTPSDPVDYGNYDTANRPFDGNRITGVVVHDIEGTCEAAVAAFQDPYYYVSAHYVVCADGRVIQMVKNKDVAWHAGNYSVNMKTIGIEHAGYSARGTTEYTPQMYLSSVLLVRWLAQTYGFPLDRGHVFGHDNVPASRSSGVAGMHTDPGPYWWWQNYLAALGAFPGGQVNPLAPKKNSLITIAPVWPLSKQVVTGCNTSHEVPPPCVPSGGPFPTNFVYMRNSPSETAPLISDVIVGPGSTEIENNAARAFYGQKFGVIGSQKVANGTQDDGMWYQVWFNGQAAWFHSPWNAPTAMAASGQCITPLPEQASVAVYGRAVPELSEYPADLNPPPGSIPTPTPLTYTVPYNQCYALIDTVGADWYYAWTYNSSLPYDHTVFKGAQQYHIIWYNSRMYLVKANLMRPATVG